MPPPTRPALRRGVTVPGLAVAVVVAVVLTPLALPALVVVDVVTGRPRLRLTRLWALVVGAASVELAGLVGAGVLWVLSGFGRGLRSGPSLAAHHHLQLWWVAAHLAVARVTVGLRVEVEDPAPVASGDAIVCARHVSHLDAVLPAWLFGCRGGHRLRYTLKDDLLWAPAMDVVGNRLPNVFLDRGSGPGSTVAEEVRDLAAGVDGRSVAVIFPEGTFFTPGRHERAVARLARTRPDLAERARSLVHVLPPRPAGTLALLDGAPTADVVVVGHVGFESVGTLAELLRSVPLSAPVRVRLWRHPRATIPTDDHARTTWLLDRWVELDRWITQAQREVAR